MNTEHRDRWIPDAAEAGLTDEQRNEIADTCERMQRDGDARGWTEILAEVTREVTGASAPRFRRTSLDDGASEILTIVQVEGRDGYLVEVCSGPNVGDDFVGLYDLDGDQIDCGNCTWTRATIAPAEVIEAVEFGWKTGSATVTRIA